MHKQTQSLIRRFAKRLHCERGMTALEVLVAAGLVAVGLMGLVSSFDHSRQLVTLSEKTEVASHQAEREIERIMALPYASVALTANPTNSASPSNPAYYVTAGSPGSYQWDQGATGPRSNDVVVDATNGTLTPVAITWTDSASRLSGSIYRYVTWTDDLCASCTGVQRAKRVTVAVTVNGAGAPRKPILISTIKIDPSVTG